MTNFINCQACGKTIPPERIFSTMIVCSCGWTDSPQTESFEKERFRKTNFTIIGGAVLILAVFFHIVHWDNYSLAIIPLKIKELTGTASPKDHLNLIEICTSRHKYDCLKGAYKGLYRSNKDISLLAKLGQIEKSTGDLQSASDTLGDYAKLGGKDKAALASYAEVLNQTGRTEEALKIYKRILAGTPGTLQISLARSYVSLLIENKKYAQARKTLEFYRKKATINGYFMEKEYQALNKKLRSSENKS
ncbi:MAG: tetratricopeptide repeat protein [Bdellovibrionales bacterium]|nr:tetratricopeptide repeat protein [Bdellovibrionales bacterium]